MLSNTTAQCPVSEAWFQQKGLNFVDLNIHFLYPKLDEIRLLSSQQPNIHVFCLCETFLNETFLDEELHLAGYKMFRKDRVTHGGGLVIYVKEDIPCIRRLDLDCNDIETLWIEFQPSHSKHFLICSSYRPPSSDNNWFTPFSRSLEQMFLEGKECIVVGDFNIDLNKSTCKSKSFTELMEGLNFNQMVTKNTRVTNSSSTLIDHVFSNRPSNITFCDVKDYSISDHFPICFTRKISGKGLNDSMHKTINYRSLKHFDESHFLLELSNQPWQLISTLDSPSDSIDIFVEMFTSTLNKFAPKRVKRVKRANQPNWMNKEILEAIRIREKFRKSRDTLNYKCWRQKVKALIFQAKKQYFSNEINSSNKNAKNLWKSLRELSGLKNTPLTKHLNDDDGRPITDIKTTANLFNSHFSNICQSFDMHRESESNANSLHECTLMVNENKLDIPPFTIPPIPVSFVLHQLQRLNVSKSTGHDGLNASFLKMSASIIAPVLTKIFNVSIVTGDYPKLFKTAKVIPIHKRGPTSDKSNYRPISILPVISLILERHVSIHFRKFLEDNKLLYLRQSGFRSRHSCQTALVNLIDEWIMAIDNNTYVGAVFLDLSKAFDLVDHHMLLQKLKKFHLSKSAIAWFTSYLEDRHQFVQIQGFSSDSLRIISGVPQGSVLGPLLFLLYMNDLPSSVKHTTVDMFADDTTISTSSSSLDSVTHSLTADIENINKWCDSNKMHINLSKTKVMYLSSKSKMNTIHNSLVPIHFKVTELTCSSAEKLLGVIVDNTISWSNHVEFILKKCTSLLYLLSRIKHFLSVPFRKLFFNSYILPHLDYCCIVWGNCNSIAINKVVLFQKRAARLILDADLLTPSKILFARLNWLPFPQRIQFHKAILLYKIFSNQAPEYLSDIFTPVSSIHSISLRSATDMQLYSPRPKTEILRKSFLYSGSKLWNSIPNHIKKAPTLSQFKSLYLQSLGTIQ